MAVKAVFDQKRVFWVGHSQISCRGSQREYHREMLADIAGAVSTELIGAAGQADSDPVFPGK